jgi:hypothetical protein
MQLRNLRGTTMQDIMQLVATIMTALAPYAVKGGEAVAAELSKSALSQVGGLLKAMKDRWTGKPGAENTLNGYLADPAANEERLKDMLLVQLPMDPELQAALAAIIQPRPGVAVKVTASDGDTAIGMRNADVEGMPVAVEVKTEGVKEVTGIDGGVFRS